MEFTKEQFNSFRQDFKDTIKKLENKYGVQINIGTITYDNIQFHTKMTVVKGETSYQAGKAEWENFVRYNSELRDAFKFGDMFRADGYVYTITGVKPNKRKYPIVTKRNDGKSLLCSIDFLLQNKENILTR